MENIKEKIDKYINNINLLKTPAHFIKELFNDLSNKINLNENNIVNINNTINNIQRDVKTKEEFHSNKLDLTENKYYVNYSILDKFQIGDISYNSTFPTIDIIGNNLSLLLPKSIKLKNELIDFNGINKYILNVLNGTCSIEKYPFGLGTKHSNLELKFTDLYSPKSPYLPLYKLETGEIIELTSGLTEGTYIYLNDDITTINSNAFYNCDSLLSIKIPYGVTSIGDSVFESCYLLESITIPESVTHIGNRAFSYCDNLSSVHINNLKAWCNILLGDGTIYLGNNPATPFNSRTSYDEINNIYLNEEPIIDLILPEGVTKINSGVFENCNQIKTLTIPKSLKSIGLSAFLGCKNLKEIHIPDLQTWCNIEGDDNGLFNLLILFGFDDETLYLLLIMIILQWNPLMLNVSSEQSISLVLNNKKIINLNIPNDVISINSGVFVGSNIQTITGGNNLKTIGSGAFTYNLFLHKVTLPKNLINIGALAFAYCDKLSNIIIPNNVKTIGPLAFGACTNLSSVILGENLTNIQLSAFGGCTSLSDINIPANVNNIGPSVFEGCTSLSSITVDKNNKNYIAINNILYDKEMTTLMVCGINENTLILPDTIQSIEEGAILKKLDSLYVSDANILFNISYNSYWDSDKLSFYANSPVEKSDKLYINNELVEDYSIPEEITEINNLGFYGYSGLKSIIIPKNMKHIKCGCFADCPNLTSVVWNAINCSTNYDEYETPFVMLSPSYWGDGNSTITSFIFGDLVEYIPAHLCSYLGSLTSITIPSSVTEIDWGAFYNCNGLTSIIVQAENPPTISWNTFTYNSELQIYVPDESVDAYKTATNWSDYSDIIKPLSEKPE